MTSEHTGTAVARRVVASAPQWLIALGSLLALVSLAIGFHNALGSSNDFQWSPARLLWHGVNPYDYILGPQHPDIILSQSPNYGHLLYLLLWPYAAMDWPDAKFAWAITNLVFLGVGLWLLGRTLPERAARQQFLITALLLCIGLTARNVVANGQQTLIVFIALVLFLLYRERPIVAGLALALLLTKYSFGLQVLLLAIVLGYYRAAVLAVVISVAAIVAFGSLSGTGGVDLVIGPVSVARAETSIGFGDLLSLGRRLTGGDPFANLPLVALSVAVNLAYFGLMKCRFRGRTRYGLGTVALLLGGTVYLSLGTVYHMKYDYLTVVIGLYAFVLTGVLRPAMYFTVLIAHFLLYWMLPRHDSLFDFGPASTALVGLNILSFLSLAAYSLSVAFGAEVTADASVIKQKMVQKQKLLSAFGRQQRAVLERDESG